MNKDKFWELIDKAREKGNGWENMMEPLVKSLTSLDMSQLILWQQIFFEYQSLSYKSKLWAAAYVIHGGCSDDCFDYFRAWLTAQGKDVFMNALANPDSLADVKTCHGDVSFEDMLGAASSAFFHKLPFYKKFGKRNYELFYTVLDKYPLPISIKNEMSAEIMYDKDIDIVWDEDNEESIKLIVPKLWEKFD